MKCLPTITQIQKFPEVTKGSESDFTYYKLSLKILYMCMICRVFYTSTDTFPWRKRRWNW